MKSYGHAIASPKVLEFFDALLNAADTETTATDVRAKADAFLARFVRDLQAARCRSESLQEQAAYLFDRYDITPKGTP